MKRLKIALCQINPTVGDLPGNGAKILRFYRHAVEHANPDIVLFPELSLAGYPPEDLLLQESFVRANGSHLKILAKEMKHAGAVVGFVHSGKGKIFNSAAVVERSKVREIYSKQCLPNYGVFDEKRYFSPGKNTGVLNLSGVPVGISICEDIWENGPAANRCIEQAKKGAKILLNISASPYHAGKINERLNHLKATARRSGCPVVYANLVGGQDELVFDGRSMVLDREGNLVVLAKSFAEDIKVFEFEMDSHGRMQFCSARRKEPLPPASLLLFPWNGTVPDGTGTAALPNDVDEIYAAMVLGAKDYVQKNGFRDVVVGLSGGIDSSLTACVAVDALGKERVIGVTMPSRYSSAGTRSDARRLAENLGIKFLTIPIERVFKSFINTLHPVFKNLKADITEENLQPRIRGTILMALSNKFGYLVLTTGNKSEIAVGYSTLYGDTAGGYAVIKDAPKTLVYRLSEWANKKSGKILIPKTVFTRAPTAELKPNQKDQDRLPPYDLLDKILRGYVEEDRSYSELARRGFNKKILRDVIRMVDKSEYKRRQSPPGVKITPKSFGRDRRMPITNRFPQF